jgi:hypothetical protein
VVLARLDDDDLAGHQSPPARQPIQELEPRKGTASENRHAALSGSAARRRVYCDSTHVVSRAFMRAA